MLGALRWKIIYIKLEFLKLKLHKRKTRTMKSKAKPQQWIERKINRARPKTHNGLRGRAKKNPNNGARKNPTMLRLNVCCQQVLIVPFVNVKLMLQDLSTDCKFFCLYTILRILVFHVIFFSWFSLFHLKVFENLKKCLNQIYSH